MRQILRSPVTPRGDRVHRAKRISLDALQLVQQALHDALTVALAARCSDEATRSSVKALACRST
jgi:hypothetical protein